MVHEKDFIMYFPYFRSKQYELIVIRDCVDLLSQHEMSPIIEPVKENISSLDKTCTTLTDHAVPFILIINPVYGFYSNDHDLLMQKISECEFYDDENHSLGYIIGPDSDIDDVISFIDGNSDKDISLIHYGYEKGKVLGESLKQYKNIRKNIFVDGKSGKLYQKHIESHPKVLVRDGFKTMPNREYPDSEHFSDLHITYQEEGMDDYGDFLIVGDEYKESGGPAHTVAIHITYLTEEDDMYIKHYKSDRQTSPVDPAGKFIEALAKLIEDLDASGVLLESEACQEFRELYDDGHYPGLGYVKKLSMQHHIELMSHYLDK